MRRHLFACMLAALALVACAGSGPAGGGAGEESLAADAHGGDGAGSGTEGMPVDEPEPIEVRYVAPGGDDGADGSAATPWGTVAHAVESARPGMKIVVRGGTWPALDITAVDGTAEAPIVLQGAVDARPIFTGPVQVRRAHWVIDGIEVASSEPSFSLRFTGAGSHDDVIRNSVIRDGRGAAGISIDLDAHRIRIEANEIFGIDRGATDAHGIVVQPRTRDVTIVGNEIHGNSGDSVQCIGPGQDAVGGSPANGVVIEGNHFFDNRENAVDIKHCENVTIRGNVVHGFRRSSTSNGEAIVVHLLARNVVVEENDVSDASRGIVTGRGAAEVLVRRNRIHGLSDERTGVIFGEGAGLQAVHNTIVGAARGVQALEGSNLPIVRNNLFDRVAEAVQGEAAVDTNLFSASPPIGENAIEGEAALDGDLVPGEGSAALDAAAEGDAAPFCGPAPDLGAIERC